MANRITGLNTAQHCRIIPHYFYLKQGLKHKAIVVDHQCMVWGFLRNCTECPVLYHSSTAKTLLWFMILEFSTRMAHYFKRDNACKSMITSGAAVICRQILPCHALLIKSSESESTSPSSLITVSVTKRLLGWMDEPFVVTLAKLSSVELVPTLDGGQMSSGLYPEPETLRIRILNGKVKSPG